MQLQANESEVFQTKLHWINLRWFILFATAALLTGVFMPGYPMTDGIGAALGAFVLFGVYPLLSMKTSQFIVTNKRAIFMSGILNKKTIDIQLAKIEGCQVTTPILGRFLGYGDIVVRGTGIKNETHKRVDNAVRFVAEVNALIDSQRSRPQ